MESQAAKNYLEELHIKYLLKHFNLQPGKRKRGWDFFATRHCLELKTRLYYLDRNFGNTWFGLPEKQCTAYKAADGKERYWLLVAAMPAKPLEYVNKLTERYIVRRDIFFVPWEIYLQFPLGKAAENSKFGPERHVSVRHLKELEDFDIHSLPKAEIFLPKGAGLEYLLKTKN